MIKSLRRQGKNHKQRYKKYFFQSTDDLKSLEEFKKYKLYYIL
jgi:hypothetical protein